MIIYLSKTSSSTKMTITKKNELVNKAISTIVGTHGYLNSAFLQ